MYHNNDNNKILVFFYQFFIKSIKTSFDTGYCITTFNLYSSLITYILLSTVIMNELKDVKCTVMTEESQFVKPLHMYFTQVKVQCSVYDNIWCMLACTVQYVICIFLRVYLHYGHTVRDRSLWVWEALYTLSPILPDPKSFCRRERVITRSTLPPVIKAFQHSTIVLPCLPIPNHSNHPCFAYCRPTSFSY